MVVRAFFLGLLVVAGCAGPATIPMGELCAERARMVCSKSGACGCRTFGADCMPVAQARCDAIVSAPELVDAVARGAVVYDGVAAAFAIDSTGGPGNCRGASEPPSTLLVQRATWGGLFHGTIPPGGACSGTLTPAGIETCADGVCMAGSCRAFARIGDPCDASTLCVDEGREIALAGDGPTATCTDGRCVSIGAREGEACTADAQCASGTCGSFCLGLDDGAACSSGAACKSQVCDGTCHGFGPTASTPCSTQADCGAVFWCNGSECVQPICADVD